MKKITFLVAALLSLTSVRSLAQASANNVSYVTLTGLRAPDIANGKQQPVFTTSNYISRNPGLIASTNDGCHVTEFSVSIAARGKIVASYSVKGSTLTPEIVAKVKETKGPAVLVSIENVKAKNTDGAMINLAPVTLKYDQ